MVKEEKARKLVKAKAEVVLDMGVIIGVFNFLGIDDARMKLIIL